MSLAVIQAHLEAAGHRVHQPGDVPNRAPLPYLLLYALQPRPIRALSRDEGARQWRFGVTCVDASSQRIEGDADAIEELLEGSRILGPLSRIELVQRGPTTRDAEVTLGGVEVHTLPTHWTTTLPKETP